VPVHFFGDAPEKIQATYIFTLSHILKIQRNGVNAEEAAGLKPKKKFIMA
jgi:hypothetical protein